MKQKGRTKLKQEAKKRLLVWNKKDNSEHGRPSVKGDVSRVDNGRDLVLERQFVAAYGTQ